MLAALPLVLALAAAPAADHAVLVDIRHAQGHEVEALKQQPGIAWWLELGDSLLLAGDPGALPRLAPQPVLGELANVAPGQLLLQARDGHAHADRIGNVGSLVARAGRWELRRLNPGEAMPAADDRQWRRVEPDSVVARQYRLDGVPAAPADPLVQPIVDAIDDGRWFSGVERLAGWNRHSYSTQLPLARAWIGGEFEALGLAVTAPAFPMGSRTVNNIVGTWTGTQRPDEWIVVGGHYDSINQTYSGTSNTPGAEDNASGCSGVIELARALVPFKPQRSVIFMCYAGEEQGLYGSHAHVRALQQAGDLGKIKGVATMDMIGYSADATLDVLLETDPGREVFLQRFAAAAATYAPELNIQTSYDAWGSDHVPYLDAGLDALLSIEADYDIYPYYHNANDQPWNMGDHVLAMGGGVLRTNAAALADLTGASDRIFGAGNETP